MSLSTYRALGSRRASSSGRELSALMETFVSSSPKNFQQNEEQQKQRRRCSTSSTLRIPDMLRDRKILAKCNSRPISWQRGYAASSAPVPAAVAVASESSFDVVSSTVATALQHVQLHSGLPWWATLGATACIIRISMLPILSKQMKASVLIAHATSVLQAKKKREAEKRLADKDAKLPSTRSRKSSNFQRRFRNVTNS